MPRLSLSARLGAAFAFGAALVCGGGAFLEVAPLVGVAFWLLNSALAWIVDHMMLRGLHQAAREARNIADNPAMQQVYTGRDDEIGNLQFAVHTMQAQLRTALGRIRENAAVVANESNNLSKTANDMTDSMQVQQREIDMIATAAEQQSSVSEEISRNIHRISAAASQLTRCGQSARQIGDTVARQAADLDTLIRRFST